MVTLDWVYFIALILFFVRGYQKGFVLAIASVLAMIIGISAALKLSGSIASLFVENHPSVARWIPFVVYLLIFVGVGWLIRRFGYLVQRTAEAVALGGINRIVGGVLYGVIVSLVFSVFFWLFFQMGLISEETAQNSLVFSTLEPLAPNIISGIGKVIPLFKDGFGDLNGIFEHVNQFLK